MLRIVKSGVFIRTTLSGESSYLESDTIEIKADWRPNHYKDQKEIVLGCKFCDKSKCDCNECQCSIGYNEGFSACLKALEELGK